MALDYGLTPVVRVIVSATSNGPGYQLTDHRWVIGRTSGAVSRDEVSGDHAMQTKSAITVIAAQ
jgi:hypothetical protein